MTVRERPAGRYGDDTAPRKRRRAGYWLLVALFLIAGLVVAYVGYRNLGDDPFNPEVTAFVVQSDHAVKIDIDVTPDQPGRPVDCIVFSLSSDGDEAGRREVYVPPGHGTVHVTTVLHTSKRPVGGEVFGCSYQVPSYLANTPPPSG